MAMVAARAARTATCKVISSSSSFRHFFSKCARRKFSFFKNKNKQQQEARAGRKMNKLVSRG